MRAAAVAPVPVLSVQAQRQELFEVVITGSVGVGGVVIVAAASAAADIVNCLRAQSHEDGGPLEAVDDAQEAKAVGEEDKDTVVAPARGRELEKIEGKKVEAPSNLKAGPGSAGRI